MIAKARWAELVVYGEVVADASTGNDGIRRYRDAAGRVVTSRVVRNLSNAALEEMDGVVFGALSGLHQKRPQDRAEGRGVDEGSAGGRNAKGDRAHGRGTRVSS